MDNYTLTYDSELKLSKWVGYPDADYLWEGERLSYERKVKDEEGNDILVKTYKDPIEIIADFKLGSKVLLASSEIEIAVAKKFGPLKGFVWLEKVKGSGEVVLPFTAPHIFIASDRFNPVLTEIFTDPNSDNYYEVVKEDIDGELVETGKTRVFVKSFSGIGGAAGAADVLIAHYKMNENTPNDNDELVTNGIFTAWTTDTPNGWTVVGEVGGGAYGTRDPEISQVATGQLHANAGSETGGMCNLYTSTGAEVLLRTSAAITLVIGRKYQVSINIDTTIGGNTGLIISERSATSWIEKTYTTTGIKTFTFKAIATNIQVQIRRHNVADITFDNVSIKLCAVEDSSGNDHDGLAQRDTSDLNRTGKINGAFDFNGSSDYIEIADHADFDVSTISISAWINPDDFATTRYIIAKLEDNISELSYSLSIISNGRIVFILSTNGTTFQEKISSTGLITIGVWNHIVVTYKEGVGVKFYVNGVFDKLDATETGVLYIGTGRVTIGARYDSSDGFYRFFFNGLIDNVMFFGVELTPDEVKRIYNNGHGTEIIAEIDPVISPRRSNTSPLGLRKRYEFA